MHFTDLRKLPRKGNPSATFPKDPSLHSTAKDLPVGQCETKREETGNSNVLFFGGMFPPRVSHLIPSLRLPNASITKGRGNTGAKEEKKYTGGHGANLILANLATILAVTGGVPTEY